MAVYTIGHSNYGIRQFIQLLQRFNVTAVADVRSSPFSNKSPQYNRDDLKASLALHNIRYVFLGHELGARSRDPKVYVNGHARYELIAETPEFGRGIDRIRAGAEKFTLALMCAERDPITCHRTILISRYITDLDVQHIIPGGILEPHPASMQRVVNLLAGGRMGSEYNENILEQAYRIQGERICFTDEKLVDVAPKKPTAEPKML